MLAGSAFSRAVAAHSSAKPAGSVQGHDVVPEKAPVQDGSGAPDDRVDRKVAHVLTRTGFAHLDAG